MSIAHDRRWTPNDPLVVFTSKSSKALDVWMVPEGEPSHHMEPVEQLESDDNLQESESKPSPFSALPLDRSKKAFRLWKFSNRVDDDRIHLELAVFERETCPPYVALSYMWGSYDDARTVLANNAALQVTKNLHDFLVVLQNDDKYSRQWFWADQISMDQTNIEERDHQVELMGDLYSQSQIVFAYLGEKIASLSSLAIWSDEAPTTEIVLGCLDILTRPYWTRLWIVQELRLARTVIFWCGEENFLRQELWHLSLFLEFKGRDVLTRIAADPSDGVAMHRERALRFKADIQFMSAILRESKGVMYESLHLVLDNFSHKDCLDPRDKVFGLQSLVRPDQRIPVNYSISLERLLCQVLESQLLRAQPSHYPPSAWPAQYDATVRSILFFEKLLPEGLIRAFPHLLFVSSMSWSFLIARIPKDIDWRGTSWAEWKSLWEEIWARATTFEQCEFARKLCECSARYIKRTKASNAQLFELPRCTSLSPSDLPEAGNTACEHCDILAHGTRCVLQEAAWNRFNMFESFLCSYSDWPFPKMNTHKVPFMLNKD